MIDKDLEVFIGTLLALALLVALVFLGATLTARLRSTRRSKTSLRSLWRGVRVKLGLPEETGRIIELWSYPCTERYECLDWLNYRQRKIYSRLSPQTQLRPGDQVHARMEDENGDRVTAAFIVTAVGKPDTMGGVIVKVADHRVVKKPQRSDVHERV